MAQKVNIILIDDIDESDASETVFFGLDGVQYEIDLSASHAAELRDSLAGFVGHARKVTGARRTRRAASAASADGDTKAIRTWAKENGYEVSDRGRVSAEIREAYASAH